MLPFPHAVNSPTTSSSTMNSGYEISIRSRLVKQASGSYLIHPMSSSVGNSSAPNFLRRLYHRVSFVNHNRKLQNNNAK
ncbi:hypothetical protein MTR_4g085050 [Medicago truncatula]|uniref:Uncharacterized protein n=1 Tax=Medicago truncatula TaxID=3880 RepID=A0A072UNF0_MEDTR|nr:hypothetical protein MTR_4g085050 [Medicago truncatula]